MKGFRTAGFAGGLFVVLAFCIILMSVNLYWDALGNDLSKNERVYSEIGRVVSEGGVPYRDTWDHKPPLIYVLLAVFIRAFGNSALSIHLAGVFLGFLFALVCSLFAFEITRSIAAATTALLAGLFYGALWAARETSPDSLMVVLGAASFAIAYRGRRSSLLMMLSGLVFAGAFFSKQPILTHFPALLLLSFWDAGIGRRWRNVISLVAGVLFGLMLVVAWAWAQGIGEAFWYQAFETNFLYSLNEGQKWHFQDDFMGLFREYFLGRTVPFLLPLIVAGIPSAALGLKKARLLTLWLLSWLFLSFVGAMIGRAMTPTYFSQTLPPLIMLNAAAVPHFVHLNRRWQSVILIAVTLLVSIPHDDWLRFPAFRSLNSEAKNLAPLIDFISDNTSPDQCLWTWGEFEGHVNYYAARHSCTRQLQSMPMMVSQSFDVTRNRIEYMEDLITTVPALHVRSEVWGYFPELQKYAERYLGSPVFRLGNLTVFQVDRSMWHPRYANYGNQIELMGIDLSSVGIVPGQELRLSLTWRVLQPVLRQYGLFVQLHSQDHQTQFAQFDGLPASDRPTETWANAKEIILGDVIALDIPEDLPPGEYFLVAGFYDYETLTALEVWDASGQFEGDYSLLAELKVDE